MSKEVPGAPDRRRFLGMTAAGAATLGLGFAASGRGSAPAHGMGTSALPPSIAALSSVLDKAVPIGDDEYRARLAKAQRLMAEQGMDALFVGAGTSLKYFVDLNWWGSERTAGVLLARHGDPVYITPDFERSRALEQIRFGKDVRTWQENESPFALIADTLRGMGVATGTLGIEEKVPFFIAEGIAQAAPQLKLANATPVTAGCRAVKSEAEIALLQIANDATLACYRAVWQALQPGMTQQDVQALVAQAYGRMGVRGAVDINVGKYTAQPHGSIEPQRIVEGTVVILDDGCQVHGYTSDITRTFVLGKATDKMKRVFALVQKAQIAAREAARTGGMMGDIDAAARKVIADGGYGPGYRFFTHRLGHGIGMDMHEWYYAVGDSRQPILSNMTLSDEPGVYIPGEFGVRLEECMVTTPEGGRWFTPQSPSIEQPFG
ncbi:M24 family metallopeptidase [Thermomonas sp.]|uniref:M24 family metallopeptidase n=1 Tax=Thermomonas sp. TaxID=1971895 RepID=UPI00262CF24F|nr:M24 family metallopeptidase [Thermomonas sp.]